MPSDGDDRPFESRIQEIVFPNHTNHLGTLFGGQALAWMDKAAFLAGYREAGGTVVTARSERIDFIAPIRQGDIVDVLARIERVGTTSLTVAVELWRASGAPLCCARGAFVMIAVDRDGRPRPIGHALDHDGSRPVDDRGAP
jgi:acyl-CoA hydrolase